MPIEILMPTLSPTMQAGKLVRWLKQEGEQFKPGQVLFEIETDKATMEVEATEEGRLSRILVPAGTEEVLVGTKLALVIVDDEPASEEKLDLNSDEQSPQTYLPSSTNQWQAQPLTLADQESLTLTENPSTLEPQRVADVAPNLSPRAVADSGELASQEVASQTVREALRDAIAEEMRRDEKVFILGEEVAEYQGAYKVTQGLLAEFGAKRVIDTPITEQGFAGLGIGAGFYGLKPIVEFMTMNFAMQAIDQIINSAAKTLYMSGGQLRCSIVFRGPNGAAARVAAQHSQCYASWYAHCPGLIVIAPYSATDAKGLLKAAIRDPNPVVFLEHELLYGQSFPVPLHGDLVLPIGQARTCRAGRDVTIVGFSRMVAHCLSAAGLLAEQGIEAEVIDLRTLRPLDIATVVTSVRKTNRLVSVEEGWSYAGIGAEIFAQLIEHAFDDLDAPPMRVCGADVPLPYAANLETLALPRPENIVKAALEVCYRN